MILFHSGTWWNLLRNGFIRKSLQIGELRFVFPVPRGKNKFSISWFSLTTLTDISQSIPCRTKQIKTWKYSFFVSLTLSSYMFHVRPYFGLDMRYRSSIYCRRWQLKLLRKYHKEKLLKSLFFKGFWFQFSEKLRR